MLWSERVGERDAVVDVGGNCHQAVIGQGFHNCFLAIEPGQEAADLFEDGCCGLGPGRHKYDGGVGPMFGLADHVGGHDTGISRFVDEYEGLTGAGGQVNSYITEHDKLGRRHPGVPRSDDFLYGFDRLGPVCQCADRLRTAHCVHLAGIHEGRRGQHHIRDRSFRAGRSSNHDLSHAGDARRNCAHQKRRRVFRATPWDVNGYSTKRRPPPINSDARRRGNCLRLGNLRPMHCLDCIDDGLERGSQVVGHARQCCGGLRPGDQEPSRWRSTTEAAVGAL